MLQPSDLCVPGDRLFAVEDGYCAGNGCYEIYGHVNASLVGRVKVLEKKLPVSDYNIFCLLCL